MERADLTMEDWIQETCLISAVTSGPTEPKTFQEAWHYPVENERDDWRAAIRKGIRSMINRGVWRKTDRAKITKNRRLIGNKWVFKIKRDGTYRARLVALGYSQIPGDDYTDNFAPVAHDVSFRIALARMMVEKFDSLVMDVETAFLYGEIDEEIFMKSPVGMEEIDPGSSSEDCYQLLKGIYGLCQAARQFLKKFVNTVKQEPFGFQVSPADPCMLFKKNELGVCIIIMYVDDMLVIGKKEQIQDFSSKIQKEFSVKIQHNLALKALSDSYFASDKETRIRVFGYIIYFCGIPITWRSKGMKRVVLSTTEAEYMALSEAVKELKVIVQLLQTMNIEVELPITVYVDNVGAIWLSNNRTTSDRTKHIDIRTSFVKEYQEDGKIIIKFVKSEDNEADIFTKNTANVIFHNHQKKLVWDKVNVDNEIKQKLTQSENSCQFSFVLFNLYTFMLLRSFYHHSS